MLEADRFAAAEFERGEVEVDGIAVRTEPGVVGDVGQKERRGRRRGGTELRGIESQESVGAADPHDAARVGEKAKNAADGGETRHGERLPRGATGGVGGQAAEHGHAFAVGERTRESDPSVAGRVGVGNRDGVGARGVGDGGELAVATNQNLAAGADDDVVAPFADESGVGRDGGRKKNGCSVGVRRKVKHTARTRGGPDRAVAFLDEFDGRIGKTDGPDALELAVGRGRETDEVGIFNDEKGVGPDAGTADEQSVVFGGEDGVGAGGVDALERFVARNVEPFRGGQKIVVAQRQFGNGGEVAVVGFVERQREDAGGGGDEQAVVALAESVHDLAIETVGGVEERDAGVERGPGDSGVGADPEGAVAIGEERIDGGGEAVLNAERAAQRAVEAGDRDAAVQCADGEIAVGKPARGGGNVVAEKGGEGGTAEFGELSIREAEEAAGGDENETIGGFFDPDRAEVGDGVFGKKGPRAADAELPKAGGRVGEQDTAVDLNGGKAARADERVDVRMRAVPDDDAIERDEADAAIGDEDVPDIIEVVAVFGEAIDERVIIAELAAGIAGEVADFIDGADPETVGREGEGADGVGTGDAVLLPAFAVVNEHGIGAAVEAALFVLGDGPDLVAAAGFARAEEADERVSEFGESGRRGEQPEKREARGGGACRSETHEERRQLDQKPGAGHYLKTRSATRKCTRFSS